MSLAKGKPITIFLDLAIFSKIMILDLSGFIDRLHVQQKSLTLIIFCFNSADDVDKSSKLSAYNGSSIV